MDGSSNSNAYANSTSTSQVVPRSQSPVVKRARLDNSPESDAEEENDLDLPFKQTDLALVVEKKKIYVNKEVLKSCSPVFKSMLESGFKEKNQKEIRLPDKSYHDMMVFMRCMLPYVNEKITVHNATIVIPLADEYQVEHLRKDCDKVIEEQCTKIFTSSDFIDAKTIIKCLEVSEKFDLSKALQASIKAASYLDIDDLEAEENYGMLSMETRRQVSKANRQLWETLSVIRERDIPKFLENFPRSNKYMPRWKRSCEEIISEKCRESIRDDKRLEPIVAIRFLTICEKHGFNTGLEQSIKASVKNDVRDFDRRSGPYSLLSPETKAKVLRLRVNNLEAKITSLQSANDTLKAQVEAATKTPGSPIRRGRGPGSDSDLSDF